VSCTSDGEIHMCTYSPPPDFSGSDTFTYTISDGQGGTDTATVTVTVNPVADPPVAMDDSATTNEDTPVEISVLDNDSDPDGDTLTISAYDTFSSQGGRVSCTAGVCTYSPPADFNGSDTFTYTISDGHGGTDTATVTVTVNPIADPPVAVDDEATTDKDTPVSINVLDNDSDPDGDTLTVSAYDTASSEGGTVSCTSAGLCTYTPPAGFTGSDSFAYTVSDGHGGTDTATVTVNIAAPGPLPHGYYLPLIMHNRFPDLVVDSIIVTSSRVEVVIKNEGAAPVLSDEAFRVDLYINPSPAPTGVNETWESLGNEGIAWIVTEPALPLEPGGVINLTIGDAYYRPSLSNFPGSLSAGTTVYAQVDSANGDTAYGAVLEIHEAFSIPYEPLPSMEYNNIAGPVISTTSAAGKRPVKSLSRWRKARTHHP